MQCIIVGIKTCHQVLLSNSRTTCNCRYLTTVIRSVAGFHFDVMDDESICVRRLCLKALTKVVENIFSVLF